MKKHYIFLLIFWLNISWQKESRLISEQLTYSRVGDAFSNHWFNQKNDLELLGINSINYEIYLRAFKEEQELEVWVKNKSADTFQLFQIINFCSSVGIPGPKNKQGDFQIPEGLYYINEFNPLSDYHLSLGIDYPNLADKRRSKAANLGGDIYIHGGCQTVGCIPITDTSIAKLYILCLLSQNEPYSIPIHIFPQRMEYDNFKRLTQSFRNKELHKFWGNIRTAYVYFNLKHKLPNYKINEKGIYFFYE